MVSEEKLHETIKEHTHLAPVIKIEGKTARIFWLVQAPDSAILESIKTDLTELNVKDVQSFNVPRCELASFIVHLL